MKDAYEEYFAAVRIVSACEEDSELQAVDLALWMQPNAEADFMEVLRYVRDLWPSDGLDAITNGWPTSWQKEVNRQTATGSSAGGSAEKT